MKIAIVGATGAVGRQMLDDVLELSQRKKITLEPGDLSLYASTRSQGLSVESQFGQSGYRFLVNAYNPAALVDKDFVLMSAGGEFSKIETPKILEKSKAIVIDNSSAWRMHSGVPLVVPEVNVKSMSPNDRIIANPNCSTIQLVVALKPLLDNFGLRKVHVSTYQSVSGAGQKGIAELGSQIESSLQFKELIPKKFDQIIAFNVLAHVGEIDGESHCGEEVKIIQETRKILNLPDLEVYATTARVPTINCHCESVLVELDQDVSLEDVQEVFREASGLKLVAENDPKKLPTPRYVAGSEDVWVSRVRLPLGKNISNVVQFWIVADNLKKGAATNAVQIMLHLINKHG